MSKDVDLRESEIVIKTTDTTVTSTGHSQNNVDTDTDKNNRLFSEIAWSVLRIAVFTILLCSGIAFAKILSDRLANDQAIDLLKEKIDLVREQAKEITIQIQEEIVDNATRYKNENLLRDGQEVYDPKFDLPRTKREIVEPVLSKTSCEPGEFIINGMEQCEQWLTCKEIRDQVTMHKDKLIGQGMTKLVSIFGKFTNIPYTNKPYYFRQ
jgi:hypothetical protein